MLGNTTREQGVLAYSVSPADLPCVRVQQSASFAHRELSQNWRAAWTARLAELVPRSMKAVRLSAIHARREIFRALSSRRFASRACLEPFLGVALHVVTCVLEVSLQRVTGNQTAQIAPSHVILSTWELSMRVDAFALKVHFVRKACAGNAHVQ